jgi:hypothetical protein
MVAIYGLIIATTSPVELAYTPPNYGGPARTQGAGTRWAKGVILQDPVRGVLC